MVAVASVVAVVVVVALVVLVYRTVYQHIKSNIEKQSRVVRTWGSVNETNGGMNKNATEAYNPFERGATFVWGNHLFIWQAYASPRHTSYGLAGQPG